MHITTEFKAITNGTRFNEITDWLGELSIIKLRSEATSFDIREYQVDNEINCIHSL